MKARRILMLLLALVGVILSLQAQAFYNPSTGRWLSRDPDGERGGLNVYEFNRNAPSSFLDRDGRRPVGFVTTPEGLVTGFLFRFPGRPGSRLDWQHHFELFTGWRCEKDEFDHRFEGVMTTEATAAYPYGSLSLGEILEAVDRGYLSPWDLPMDWREAWVSSEMGYAPVMTMREGLEFAFINTLGVALEGLGVLGEILAPAASLSAGAMEVSSSSLRGSSQTAAETATTPLWRAVKPAELSDLGANAGAFRNPLGIESKYFSETAEGAASYARQAYQAGGSLYEGLYTIVRTDIPSDLITPIMRQSVDRGVPSVVVPTELLPRLTPAQPLPFTPLPGRP